MLYLEYATFAWVLPGKLKFDDLTTSQYFGDNLNGTEKV
jgi:hypothetical protein